MTAHAGVVGLATGAGHGIRTSHMAALHVMAPLHSLRPSCGADILVKILCSEGVRHVFGNPGTTEMPLIDALADAPDLSHVLALQEASVAAMADGHAKMPGRPAFNARIAGGLAQDGVAARRPDGADAPGGQGAANRTRITASRTRCCPAAWWRSRDPP